MRVPERPSAATAGQKRMNATETQSGGSLPRLVRRFRSAASGLWYENPQAAGTINAVELDGQILERKDGEQTMPWIRRAAEWASAIHSANSVDERQMR